MRLTQTRCPSIVSCPRRNHSLFTTTAGHTILSYTSTNVFVNPPAQVGHTHPEFYTVDFDDASAQVDTTMEDSTNVDDADAPTVIEGTGITIIPRAKRYHNSVRVVCCA
jgi:hypothetical protein